MNKDTFLGKLKEIIGKVKRRWGMFTQDNITQIKGSLEEREGRIQRKYGNQKNQIRKDMNNYLKHNGWDE